jgi:hypothetical protein
MGYPIMGRVGIIIHDPKNANRNPDGPLNYTIFAGYYCYGPASGTTPGSTPTP